MAEILYQLQLNLFSPIIMCFFLGILAALFKSDLKIPAPVHELVSIYLLLAVGIKGGVSLTGVMPMTMVMPVLATLAVGVITPILSYLVLQRIGGFSVLNSAAIAAHYGSVSMITFIACIAYLDVSEVPYEGFMPALLVLLQIPGIFVALVIVRLLKPGYVSNIGQAVKEVLASRSVLLLAGGLIIGLLSGPNQYAKVEPFFNDLFPGFLAVFLLEMGIIAASRVKEVKVSGMFLVGFGVLMPVFHGVIGVLLGHVAGLSVGGSTLLGVMAASASYIAAPAAIRLALPQANPALYLTPALVVTFPFNIVFGIPLYYFVASHLVSF